jgi:nucleoside-diphosphate-sugar epimerase
MRVHVTGATGFIGGALIPELRAHGHELRDVMEGAEAVVHLANIAHARASRAQLHRVNVEGTRLAAERAARTGAKRFVYLSSAKAIAPDDAYGEVKREAEQALAQLHDIDVVALRPPLVYGPGVKANFLALLHAIDRGVPLPFGAIENRRSLLYVGNLADAIVRCLEPLKPGPQYAAYAVSDGAPVSTPDLCRAIGVALGRPARLFGIAPRLLELAPPLRRLTGSFEVDDNAIRRDLGWRPAFGLEEGLRRTAAWYRERGG